MAYRVPVPRTGTIHVLGKPWSRLHAYIFQHLKVVLSECNIYSNTPQERIINTLHPKPKSLAICPLNLHGTLASTEYISLTILIDKLKRLLNLESLYWGNAYDADVVSLKGLVVIDMTCFDYI